MHHSASTYTRPPSSTTDRLPPADLCPYTKDCRPMPADLVLLNGTVITVDDDQPTAEAVAVVGNRIARVGSNDEIRDDGGAHDPGDRSRGAGAPAGIQRQPHPPHLLWSRSQPHRRPAGERPLPRRAPGGVRTAATTTPTTVRDGWLLARGYDDSRLDVRRHPTRQELDAATGGRPPSSPAPAVTSASPTRRRWPAPASPGPPRTRRAGRSTATSGASRPVSSARRP